ncbi:MAG: RNA polymerase factor sigma-54 [Bdellovibrionales bacterium]|nr:RNA polymerase factor sigma-54 [Bdellovibrionales bacterium]
MALEAKLVQKLSQQLLMTPQLQQAIKLLQLGRLEYIEALEKELLENPVLEMVSEDESADTDISNKSSSDNGLLPADNDASGNGSSDSKDSDEAAPNSQPDSPMEWADYIESLSDYSGMASPKGLINHDDRPSLEATLSRSQNLSEYLIEQIRMMDIASEDQEIAFVVVGNLNKDGYLCSSYEEIAEDSHSSVDRVETFMEKLRQLDPPGVGARNLGECLFIQLEHLGLGEGLAARIVLNHLDKLEKRAYDKIAKIEQVAVEEVYEAVKAIQNLEPRPGRPFNDDEIRYITPDIYVYRVNSDYVIALNEDGLPRLRVSPYYLKLLKDDGEDNQPNKNYLNERLKAASWLIKSVHQRQRTIYKVTESIVKFQRDFLDYGISHLKPMVLKDVAEDIGMHESTVSRVTTNKYVHTPHGVFELKFFFTSGIQGGEGEVSSSSVKERIKQIISAEPPDSPISDQSIVETLKSEGINIARRTVAKYRESLGILSSSKRKKLF